MNNSEKLFYLQTLLERAQILSNELYSEEDPTLLPFDAASLKWGIKGALRGLQSIQDSEENKKKI